MHRPVLTALAGVFAGLSATLSMSLVMFVGRRAGLFRRYPPELAIKRATDGSGPLPELSASQRENVWPLAHLELGTVYGLTYSLFRHSLPSPLRTPLGGALLGICLWLVNYGGLAPALGLLPPIQRDDRGRQLTNALAHAVFGLTLAGVLRRIER